MVHYNFEMFTQDIEDRVKQLDMLTVKVGDWVEIGQEIGRFLYVSEGAHIHFTTSVGWSEPCPRAFLTESAETDLLSLIHSYHPTWTICYTD